MASDDYKARARARAQEIGGSAWHKLKEGENILRLLPTPESKKSPGLWTEYGLHREVGKKKETVRCGKHPITDEGSCWLCDSMIPKLRKQGKENRASALQPQNEFVVQVAKVIMVDDETPKFSGPFPFRASKTVAAQLLNTIIGAKKRVYEDPKKGYNFSITRTGTGKNDTRYSALVTDDEPTVVPESIINKLKPFSELKEIPVYSEAKQKAAYFGSDSADDDDEEEQDEEESTTKRRKGSRDVEEEEEEGDDEEGEEEEEEEKPAKKGKPAYAKPTGKKRPKDEEEEEAEDEEEEPEEEEEEEEKPKKGGKGKPAGKSKAKPEPEEEEEEEEDPGDELDDEEEEEEKPPAKSGKPKGKAKPKDEEEEEEEEAEEEEEEEKPAKKGKPAAKGKGKAKPKDEEEEEAEEAEEEEDDDDPPPRFRKRK